MQRSWLSTLAWIAWGLLAAFVALLAATNPSRADLAESVRLLTSKGLGKFAGMHKTCLTVWTVSKDISGSPHTHHKASVDGV